MQYKTPEKRSEDEADAILGVRGKEASVFVYAYTETEGKFLNPMLSYSSAESVCRSDADFRTAVVSIGTKSQ